jgi:hypothetical protein
MSPAPSVAEIRMEKMAVQGTVSLATRRIGSGPDGDEMTLTMTHG